MFRLRLVVPLLAVGLVSGSFLMGDDKKSDNEPIIVSKQLPKYYKQLSLSEKQKKEIYRVRARFAQQIEQLNQRLAAVKEEEKMALENVLTSAQKARLRELLTGTAAKSDTDSKEKAPPSEIKK